MDFLLDMDETLLDFPRLERENIRGLLEEYGCSRAAAGARCFHEINASLWRRLERGEITRQEILTKRFEMLFSELGLHGDIEKAAARYFAGLGETCYPYRGAKGFLKTLFQRGRVFILTNGAAEVQHRHIEQAGFAPYLTDVFISDEIGCNKPLDGYVQSVRAHIPDFDAGNAVYLGDSLSSDQVCAERLGVRFVLFRKVRPEGYDGPIAKNYREALELFEKQW